MMPTVKFTCFWEEDEKCALQNHKLVDYLDEYKDAVFKHWDLFTDLMKRYDFIFPEEFNDRGLFYNIYG